MIEMSSTRRHDLDQADAAFRNTAEVLALLRDQLIDHDFSTEATESIVETVLAAALER